ncbi:alpha/beta hydrolase family protein [Kitasatospora sp. NPDC004240]
MPKTSRWRTATLFTLPAALLLTATGPAAAVTGSPGGAPAAVSAASQEADRAAGPRVPAPTSHRPVGTATVRLVDHARPDPWRADRPSRELMVTLRYPTRSARGSHPPYLSPELSRALYGGLVEPSTVRTNASAGAPPAPGRHPLVVLSPGFAMSRTSLTALAEDLAARGYAVAAVDHTHETSVQFPDGRIDPCLACGQEDGSTEFGARVSRIRAADLRFVIDRLTDPNRAPVRGLTVDPGRIAAVGHSIGGAGALEAMRQDRRIRAAVNLDGTIWIPPVDDRSRPVLLFSANLGGAPEAVANWEESWNRLSGPRYWVDLPKAGHLSFSDAHWLLDAFGLRDRQPPDTAAHDYGTIRGVTALAETRAYVGAFLDRHLRGRSAPLLDGPSAAHPDVRFAK